MSRKVLALDIRHHGMAAVVLQSGLREQRIAGHRWVPLPEAETTEAGLAAALETLAAALDTGGCECVVSLPPERFSFRNLRVPFRNPKKIRMVLPFELEAGLPYPVDEIALDFSVLGHEAAAEGADLLAAVLPGGELKAALKALAACGLEPEAVTVGGLALALWHTRRAEVPGDRLVLDIDRGWATLFAAVDKKVRWIRSFPVPAENDPQALRRQVMLSLAAMGDHYEFDLENTEVLLCGHGLREGIDAGELEQALGAAAVASDVAAQAGLEVPAAGEDGQSWDARRMDHALALALAAAEGRMELNLHRSQFPARKLISRYREHLVKTGWLAAAVLAVIFCGQIVESVALGRAVSRAEQQARAIYQETFPGESAIVDPYRQMQVKLREARQAAQFDADAGRQARCIDLLGSISRQIPAELSVEISRLVISEDSVLITGSTKGYDAVDDIKNRLEQIPYLSKVTIASSNIDRSGEEVRFQIKADRAGGGGDAEK